MVIFIMNEPRKILNFTETVNPSSLFYECCCAPPLTRELTGHLYE